MKFKVVKCPNCAFPQVTSAKKIFRCQKCNKTKAVSYLNFFYSCDDGREAAKALGALKLRDAEKQNGFSDDFFSYK